MMWAEGMLLPLNHANLPNLRHVDRAFLDRFAIDSEMRYAVPFMSGTTGIAYRQSAVGADAAASWALFDRSDLRGRVTLLNDMREAIGAALKFLGHSLNSTDPAAIEAAADVVIRWKGNIAKFENEGYKPGLASGEFHLVHGYSGDIMQVIEDAGDDDIVYVLPREGFAIWADDMAIPASADNIPLAEAFINFLHDPEIAALNMAFNYYVSPNVAAYELVDAEMRADPTVFIDAEAQAKAEQIKPLGEHQALYIRAWDRIKSAR
jgi:spermidine/putrescine transport system substrate-binding protein